MKFQEGDWVLWEGEIERVQDVADYGGWVGLSNIIVGPEQLTRHQIPWHKPPGASSWKPL